VRNKKQSTGLHRKRQHTGFASPMVTHNICVAESFGSCWRCYGLCTGREGDEKGQKGGQCTCLNDKEQNLKWEALIQRDKTFQGKLRNLRTGTLLKLATVQMTWSVMIFPSLTQ
jgi:hypothetical protein